MDGDVDWRKELLQAVRSVFDSERKWLHAQLQDVMATNSSIDYSSLLKHLEMLLQKQVLKCCQLFYSYSSALHYHYFCPCVSSPVAVVPFLVHSFSFLLSV